MNSLIWRGSATVFFSFSLSSFPVEELQDTAEELECYPRMGRPSAAAARLIAVSEVVSVAPIRSTTARWSASPARTATRRDGPPAGRRGEVGRSDVLADHRVLRQLLEERESSVTVGLRQAAETLLQERAAETSVTVQSLITRFATPASISCARARCGPRG